MGKNKLQIRNSMHSSCAFTMHWFISSCKVVWYGEYNVLTES